jgi:hypothetical protein
LANIFISHRGQDSALAESLADTLRSSGHSVWLDNWAIEVGDSIIAKINKGLQGANYLVLCCSSSDIMAPWMSREWMATLARQLNGANVKILPVLLTGRNVPAIFADIKYADLEVDWTAGISELLRAIK